MGVIKSMVDTLVKFGVPLGANEGRGNMLEPKQAFKFRARFYNFGPINGGLELTQQILSVTRPARTQVEAPVYAYNSTAYAMGKATWGTIQAVFYDDITNNARTLIMSQLTKQSNIMEQTSPAAGVNAKFTMTIENMDGGDVNVLDSWYIEGCWITGHAESGNDFANAAGLNTITCTIRFDNASQLDGIMPDTVSYISGNTVG